MILKVFFNVNGSMILSGPMKLEKKYVNLQIAPTEVLYQKYLMFSLMLKLPALSWLCYKVLIATKPHKIIS